MITYKIKFEYDERLSDYLREYNSVYRFSSCRLLEDPTLLKSGNLEKVVYQQFQGLKLLDHSIIINSCNKALQLFKSNKTPKVIFGGKKNRQDYLKGLISKEEYKIKKQIPFEVIGCKKGLGNRKFRLDIENNQLLFRPKRGIEIPLRFYKLSKNWKENLQKLQGLCKLQEACLTVSFDHEYVYLIFDETTVEFKPIVPIQNRILSIDLNPNYIAFVVSDYGKEKAVNLLHKEIISLKLLTGKNKSQNKLKEETIQSSKRIIELARHFRTETVCFEKLSIQSSDKKSGKNFNRLCNNVWLRDLFINNLKKRCNIYGIKTQEVAAQYSSFIGQFMNPDEYDSIAAAIELGRRGNLFVRTYCKKEIKEKIDIVYPELPDRNLMDRWKKKLNLGGVDFSSWKNLYDRVKETKLGYRSLFDEKSNFFSLNSYKSKVRCFVLC